MPNSTKGSAVIHQQTPVLHQDTQKCASRDAAMACVFDYVGCYLPSEVLYFLTSLTLYTSKGKFALDLLAES